MGMELREEPVEKAIESLITSLGLIKRSHCHFKAIP